MKKADVKQMAGVMEMIHRCFIKKMFVIINDSILEEYYVDSVMLQCYIVQWDKREDKPTVYIDVSFDEWIDAWNTYCRLGAALSTDADWRKSIENRKVAAVREWEIGAEQKFNIRAYEAMKFVLKDKRLKGDKYIDID